MADLGRFLAPKPVLDEVVIAVAIYRERLAGLVRATGRTLAIGRPEPIGDPAGWLVESAGVSFRREKEESDN
jgi:hypothetical protein